jgi:hypothetical protein
MRIEYLPDELPNLHPILDRWYYKDGIYVKPLETKGSFLGGFVQCLGYKECNTLGKYCPACYLFRDYSVWYVNSKDMTDETLLPLPIHIRIKDVLVRLLRRIRGATQKIH